MWEKFGLTEEEWNSLEEGDREKLTGQDWQTVPCRICGKPTLVLASDARPTCAECIWKEA